MQSVMPRDAVLRALDTPARGWHADTVPWTRRILWASLAGPAALVSAVVVAGALQPGYSHRQPISLLSGADHGWILGAGLAVSGAALVVLSWVMFDVVSPIGRLAARISFISGLLIAGAGFVPCSDGCPAPWTAEAARPDVVHFALVIGAVTGLVAAPIVARRWMRRSGCSPRFRRMTGLLLFPIVAGAVLTFLSEVVPVGLLEDTTGIWQRVMILSSLTWFSITALVVVRRQH